MTRRLALLGRALARSVTGPLHRLDHVEDFVDGMQAVDVPAIADERRRAWSAVADERGVQLAVRSPKHAYVLATPWHLERALDNLISNAIDASPPGGTVVVAVRHGHGDTLHVHVVDDGPGMDAVPRAFAFERFSSGDEPAEHAGGTGIGLSFERAPGGGLDAHLTLRRAPAPVNPRRRRISEPARS